MREEGGRLLPGSYESGRGGVVSLVSDNCRTLSERPSTCRMGRNPGKMLWHIKGKAVRSRVRRRRGGGGERRVPSLLGQASLRFARRGWGGEPGCPSLAAGSAARPRFAPSGKRRSRRGRRREGRGRPLLAPGPPTAAGRATARARVPHRPGQARGKAAPPPRLEVSAGSPARFRQGER